MDTVTVMPLDEVPADLLAERKRIGLDRFDEVWDGVLHMNPAPNMRHGRMALDLAIALRPLAEAVGLEVLLEMNLIAIGEAGWNDYRIPDLMVYRPEVDAGRGVQGAPELAVEFRSPGDDSYRKLPFYEQIGTGEVLIIDRDTAAIRRWQRTPEGLVEIAPTAAGVHRLDCLPVDLRTTADQLIIEPRPH